MISRSAPASAASAATSSMPGVSTTGSNSFGTVLVAGRNRVPNPAAGTTAVRGIGTRDGVIVHTLNLTSLVNSRRPQLRRLCGTYEWAVIVDAVAGPTKTELRAEILLARGVTKVYAVDVGRGQLHERLRTDPRVVVVDGVNARSLSAREVLEPCGIATLDVSFISVLKILPALRALLTPAADALVLVKPQFEVGRFRVGRGGVVSDPALHVQAVRDVVWSAQHEQGYVLVAVCSSPITGAEGNREFFLHLRREGTALADTAVEAMVQKAVMP